MRVSPPKVFPDVAPAARPPMGAPGADAHRQTSFVLGGDVELVLTGLRLEGEVAAASNRNAYRTQRTASAMATWSRAWLTRLGALHALQGGEYVAALPLVRAATDLAAAATALLGAKGAAEWQSWLDGGAITQAPADHALEFALHPFTSAGTLAPDPVLRRIDEAATALSLPHFGATLLLAAQESTPERVAVTFGDRDFHVALAELLLGWLLELSLAALQLAANSDGAFAPPDRSSLDRFTADVAATLANPSRCRLESVERDGRTRFLVHNWRRTPGGAPRRILL